MCSLWDYGTAKQALDDNTVQCMHMACWITKATDIRTLIKWNPFCISTALLCTCMCLNVTFVCTLPVFLNCTSCHQKCNSHSCSVTVLHWKLFVIILFYTFNFSVLYSSKHQSNAVLILCSCSHFVDQLFGHWGMYT
jgi:hypothetical protein